VRTFDVACPRCVQFYLDHPWEERPGYGESRHRDTSLASPVRCAFPRGQFNKENWNCKTMNLLREAACDSELWNDDNHMTLRAVSVEKTGCGFYWVLSYYKHSGRTEGAWICCNNEFTPMTLEDANCIIDPAVPDTFMDS